MKAKIATIAALCAMLEMILAPQQMIESGRYALSLCAELIIPSLFPFFVLSGLLNRLGFAAAIAQVRRRFSWGLWAAIRWARPISPTCGGRGW